MTALGQAFADIEAGRASDVTISDGNRDRIFDPFFTTRREAGGTGMGLSIVRRLVEARGARIRLDESAGGATFVIAFDG